MLISKFYNIFFVLLLSMIFTSPAHSVAVDKPLGNPIMEARARAIHKQLRCLVCQNQAIDDSNADLARDLRVLVRERISLGDSDQEILDFMVGRYGDWVLLNPPFKLTTVALWVAHTWTFEATETTPYLSITSPEKRSGKTRLLETLEQLVKKSHL